MSALSFAHFLVMSVWVLVIASLIVAARWAFLLTRAYRLVKRQFEARAVSYTAMMEGCTTGGLGLMTTDQSRGMPGRGGSPRLSGKPARRRRDALALPSAIGEASITSALMLQDLLAVDSHFYDAMSSMAGHQIANFADLHEQVSHYATNGFGELSPHVVDNVQGHLAEQLVAEHLRLLGHHVEMAATSNQSSWDMVVDHAFRINVKDYAHAGGLGEHFQNHPDIAVVVPHAIADGPADFDAASGLDHLHHALHAHQAILSDGGLDHDTVVSHAHHALDAAHGHVPMHFPLITVCLSGWREANLLLDGSTDVARSATNIALDAAGTGAGGFAGHAAGAAIGTLICPGIGTLVGGFLGAIAGGLGGRAVTNNIKEAPLREARESYFAARNSTQALMEETRRAAEFKYACYVGESKRRLASEADAQNRFVEGVRATCSQNLLEAASFDEAEVAAFTARVRTQLHEERRQAEERLNRSWHPLKALCPDAALAVDYVIYRFTERRSTQFAERFVQIEESKASGCVRTAAYLQVSLSLGYGLEEAKRHFEMISRQSLASRVSMTRVIEQAKCRLLRARTEQVGVLHRRTREIAHEMEAAVKDAVSHLKEREAHLQHEMKAFGRA